MVLLPSMRRRLCRRRNGVVALVVMALLPSPMRRRLVVVNNVGDGAKGSNDNNGAMGNDKVNDPDNAAKPMPYFEVDD
jgi:hypothetical protein